MSEKKEFGEGCGYFSPEYSDKTMTKILRLRCEHEDNDSPFQNNCNAFICPIKKDAEVPKIIAETFDDDFDTQTIPVTNPQDLAVYQDKTEKYWKVNNELVPYVKLSQEHFEASSYYGQLMAIPDYIKRPDHPMEKVKKYFSLAKLNPEFRFKTEPYAHQLKAFYKFIHKEYFGLFMDMGTGKTKTDIDIGVYKYLAGMVDSIMVIAPNHVHTQWVTEQIQLHCSVPFETFQWVSGKQNGAAFGRLLDEFVCDKSNKLKVFAVNVEAFQSKGVIPTIKDFVKNNKPFITIDESTRIKNHGAIRSKTIHKLAKYGHRSILTGTPTAKSPFDLWSQFEFLKNDFFETKFFIFQHRYGVMMKGTNPHTGGSFHTLIDEKTFAIVKSKLNRIKETRGGKLMPDDYLQISVICGVSEKNVRFIDTQSKFAKYKRLDELKKIIEPFTFSVKKEDCLDLPPKVYETRFIEMSKDQKKVYNELKKQLTVEYDGQELSVQNKVALSIRFMQICGGFFPYKDEDDNPRVKMIGDKNVKLEALKSELEESGDNKIIIWANFIAELEMIYKELKKDYSCCLYYGRTSGADRAMMIDDFKAGKYQLFIGNTATAAFGLNLQNATTQFYFTNNFRTEERLQAEDRSHRIGVLNTCLYKDFVFKGTIEEKIVKVIQEGKDLNNYFKSNSLYEILED